jgi:hypothetical protein
MRRSKMRRLDGRFFPALALVALLTAGCGTTATPTAAPTWTPQPTYTPYPTNTPYPTLTPVPSATPTAVPTSKPTVVPTITPYPTATPDALAGIPARGQFKHTYEITEVFDRFTSKTVVSLAPKQAELRRGPNNISAFFSYVGTTPTVPSSVLLGLVQVADTWEYLRCYSLTWLLDGRNTLNPKTEHTGEVGSGFVVEGIASSVAIDDFLQILRAKKVEGKLCNTEFALSNEQMEALRDFASRMRPK